MRRFEGTRRQGAAFTLIELLVSVAIVVVLAALVILVSRKAIDKARSVHCVAQMRDVTTGLQAFIFDYQRPPLPESKRVTGWDTIYGDPGGLYGNEFLVAVLAGEDAEFETNTDEVFIPSDANPRGETYATFPVVADKKLGVDKEDGRLYDPWGRQLMIAVNTPPYRRRDANGQYDEKMMTWGLAEYEDSEPRDQQFVLWSYGKDGVKAEVKGGSDDVTSW
jgi:prepilin-type N-terminal cleavage/methylation domain-containing protein